MIKNVVYIFISILFITSCSSAKNVSTILYKNVQKNDLSISLKRNVPTYFFPKNLEVVLIGDSITEGIGDDTGNGGYGPFLKDKLSTRKDVKNVSITNLGVIGYRTDHLIKQLKNEEVKNVIADADMVLITIGGNDMIKVVRDNLLNLSFNEFNQAQMQYEKRLSTIIELIRSQNNGGTVILIGLYNPFINLFESIDEIDKVIDNWNIASNRIIVKNENMLFVNIDDIFHNNPEENLLGADQFHPNKKGYERIALRVYNQLLRKNPANIQYDIAKVQP